MIFLTIGYQYSNSRLALLTASPASDPSSTEAGQAAPRNTKSHTSSVSSSARRGCLEGSGFFLPYMSPPWKRCATQ